MMSSIRNNNTLCHGTMALNFKQNWVKSWNLSFKLRNGATITQRACFNLALTILQMPQGPGLYKHFKLPTS